MTDRSDPLGDRDEAIMAAYFEKLKADRSGQTPPTIVANADNPAAALGAFIAQELEHWGFDVRTPNTTRVMDVRAGDVHLHIGINGVIR